MQTFYWDTNSNYREHSRRVADSHTPRSFLCACVPEWFANSKPTRRLCARRCHPFVNHFLLHGVRYVVCAGRLTALPTITMITIEPCRAHATMPRRTIHSRPTLLVCCFIYLYAIHCERKFRSERQSKSVRCACACACASSAYLVGLHLQWHVTATA